MHGFTVLLKLMSIPRVGKLWSVETLLPFSLGSHRYLYASSSYQFSIQKLFTFSHFFPLFPSLVYYYFFVFCLHFRFVNFPRLFFFFSFTPFIGHYLFCMHLGKKMFIFHLRVFQTLPHCLIHGALNATL